MLLFNFCSIIIFSRSQGSAALTNVQESAHAHYKMLLGSAHAQSNTDCWTFYPSGCFDSFPYSLPLLLFTDAQYNILKVGYYISNLAL